MDVPGLRELLEQMASFSRLIFFDKRGTGLSDPVDAGTPLEVRMDDVRAVMDAAGSERAAVMGVSEGGPMSILFAATYPERAWALVLYGTYARELWAHDYPWGALEADYRASLETMPRGPHNPAGSKNSRAQVVPTRRRRRSRRSRAMSRSAEASARGWHSHG